MIFEPLVLPGAYRVDAERLQDTRGFFARTFCQEEFEQAGLDPRIAQCSISFNRRRGTLRGLHWQAPPHGESKLVRCTQGVVYDVLLDLRRDSSHYLKWCALELSFENRRAVYVPEGVAHGFLTLADETEVHYQMSVPFVPEAARGVRWDDPAFAIDWPESPQVISERDAGYEDYEG